MGLEGITVVSEVVKKMNGEDWWKRVNACKDASIYTSFWGKQLQGMFGVKRA